MTESAVFVLPLVSEDLVYWAGLLSNINTSEQEGGCGLCRTVESEDMLRKYGKKCFPPYKD